MRPYFAIIKDSFREALASYVLWVLLAVIVLFLLAIAPIGYQLNLTGELAWGDIVEGPELVTKLKQAHSSGRPSPGRRIWSLLDEDTRSKLDELESVKEERRRDDFFEGMDALRRGLNKLVADRDFYQAADWEGVALPKEARDLVARPRGELSNDELARMNRLLIESGYRAHIRSRSPNSIRVTYLGFASDPLPFSKQQADNFVKEWVLTTAMGWIVGVFGMIAAILVTSAIIPQMFDPGSITLLLSKPISRSLLFTSKFLGGCAFILLSVSLLLVGLWLIAGLRFGIWNRGILGCIPIFLFMFLIYYAVSALAGIVWKSAVVSVIVTVVFWMACFTVDFAHAIVQGALLEQQRITRIVEADEAILTVTEASTMQLWDQAEKKWRPVYEPDGGRGIPALDGPFYHEPTRQILVGQGYRNPFGVIGQRSTLRVGRASDGWALRDGPAVPSGAAALVVASDNTVLAIASDNVFRLRGNPSAQGTAIRFLGMRVPLTGGGEFRPALAAGEGQEIAFPDPLAAAADPQEPRLAICAADDVFLLAQQEEGDYIITARTTLATDNKQSEGSAVAIAGDLVLVARESGKVWLLSAADLSVRHELVLERHTQPRFVAAAPDGKQLAVLFQNRMLWLIDGQSGQASRPPLAAQGQISAVTFAPQRLLVADYPNRVVAYDSTTYKRLAVHRPALSRTEWFHYYLVQPLHTVFPKPRMLNNTVQYVLTGKRTTDLGIFQGDLQQRRDDLNPWQPVTSGLVFVGVMLLVSCLYIERHEF